MLSEDAWQCVACFLPVQDLVMVPAVCKSLKHLFAANAAVWNLLKLAHFKNVTNWNQMGTPKQQYLTQYCVDNFSTSQDFVMSAANL